MDSCLGHIWENTKWIEMKLGTYMTVRGSTGHKNDNPTLYIIELSPITIFFIMVAYPGHILDSTEGITISLGT